MPSERRLRDVAAGTDERLRCRCQNAEPRHELEAANRRPPAELPMDGMAAEPGRPGRWQSVCDRMMAFRKMAWCQQLA